MSSTEMRGERLIVLLSLLSLLALLAGSPAAASTLFGDGFEACCTVGGRVSGLQGSGLVLRLQSGADQESLAIAVNGRYRFDAVLTAGDDYSVSVQTQPASGPPCSVRHASGVIGGASVIDVDIVCSDGLVWNGGEWGEAWQ